MARVDLSFGPSFMTVRWKVRCLFRVPRNQGFFYESQRFRYLDAEWRLKVFASKMDSSSSSDWIRLWLCREDFEVQRSHRLRCRMWIEKQDLTEIGCWTTEWEFGPHSRDWCTPPLVGRSEILRGEDVLTVLCRISSWEEDAVADKGTQTQEWIGDLKEQTSGETIGEEEPVPDATGVDKLVQNFKNLLLTGEKSDLTLRVRDQEFKCHDAVLSARAPDFAARLVHDIDYLVKNTVQVEDCDPAAFALFLEHVYTGGVEILSTDTAFNLYCIADKFCVDDLKSTCVRFLSSNMSVQLFCDALSLSSQYDMSHFLEVTTAFFSENMRDILATAEWHDFLKEDTAVGNLLLMKALDLSAKTQNISD